MKTFDIFTDEPRAQSNVISIDFPTIRIIDIHMKPNTISNDVYIDNFDTPHCYNVVIGGRNSGFDIITELPVDEEMMVLSSVIIGCEIGDGGIVSEKAPTLDCQSMGVVLSAAVDIDGSGDMFAEDQVIIIDAEVELQKEVITIPGDFLNIGVSIDCTVETVTRYERQLKEIDEMGLLANIDSMTLDELYYGSAE